MRKWINAFTLIELLVVIAIIAILAGLLLPALARAREESRRKACNSNMGQMVKAMTTYQEPNGDFFPAHSQYGYGVAPGTTTPDVLYGSTDTFLPMPSLAVLYPAYVDNVKVFSCPSTSDRPVISFGYDKGARWNSFGDADGDANTATKASAKQALGYAATGTDVGTDMKCSYLYDERSHFRDVGPSQAMASDADGMTWLTATGDHPAYTSAASPEVVPPCTPTPPPTAPNIVAWYRYPQKPNHENGQNVMYFDGHISWKESAYASDDPKDNIFCPNGAQDPAKAYALEVWGADTDAYIWDGKNIRYMQKD